MHSLIGSFARLEEGEGGFGDGFAGEVGVKLFGVDVEGGEADAGDAGAVAFASAKATASVDGSHFYPPLLN